MRLPDTFREADVNQELFLSIFRDAHVVDIDMSQWDRCIRLVVVAIEATAFPTKRLPVYIVELQQVSELVINFHHYDRPTDFGHYQWNIDTVRLEEVESGFRVQLSGSRLMPGCTILFADADIRLLDNSRLDRRFPGWSKAGAPFIRAGVEQQLEEDAGKG
jgi:hypothetical protein